MDRSRFSRLAGVFSLCCGWFLSGCGNDPSIIPDDAGQATPDGTASVQDAVAISKHYVQLSFDQPPGAEAENPTNYLITHSNSTPLVIAAARIAGDGRQVILTTGEQQEIDYQLTLSESAGTTQKSLRAGKLAMSQAIVFKGSSKPEPYLSSAIALSPTSVLVTYNGVMDNNVAVVEYYEIAAPDLKIIDAVRGSTGTTAVLTTATQQHVRYLLRATNVTSKNGSELIDPTRSTASFYGIGVPDLAAPFVTGAVATDDKTVIISFSEPLSDEAANPQNFNISPSLIVTNAELRAFNTQVALTTLSQVPGEPYEVTVTNVRDKAGNPIAAPPDPNSRASFSGGGAVSGLPRVVGAASLGNTSAIVTYSKPMDDSALNPASYVIVQSNVNPEVGALPVVVGARIRDGGNGTVDTEADGDDVANFELDDAVPPRSVMIRAGDNGVIDSTLGGDDAIEELPAPQFAGPDRMAVILTTMAQNEVTYEVTVVNVKDVAGNPLAPPELLVNPSKATFPGTPASPGGGVPQDSDGDGLADDVEVRGWVVTIVLTDDQVQQYQVTSDPFQVDSDGDGLTDLDERGLHTSPRLADTDYDTVNDYDEYNVWYCEPTRQDTDGDGLHDALEISFFLTSPILADSDGDQMNDSEELFERNRNPLLSDLPVPQITVGSIRLDLQITSSFTDEQGTTTEISDSSSTSFGQSRSDTLGTSSTTSTEVENKFSQELGFEIGGSTKDGLSGKVTGKAGFEQARSQGFSSTVDRETAKASQQEWQTSVSKALSESQNRSVTRSIDAAVIQAAVNLANRSDIAFSITNLELSVLQQDRRAGLNFQPIATLRPSNDETPTFNLGPLDDERGPIIFESVNVFPNLVEDLMREPTGLVFKVVNFDILDEFGRNFAFSSQEVVERTVGIEIDSGGGIVEKHRVATTSSFDENGQPVGISLQRALEIAGITKLEGDDSALTVPSPLTPEIRKSYGVITTAAGVERLSRLRGVQNDFALAGDSPLKRLWVVLVSNEDVSEDTHFSEIPVFAGDTIQLWFTSDADEDGLFAREEYLYGSSDEDAESDGDGLDDFFEVRTGWIVNRLPGLPYKVFPDPARLDSDLDTLTDQDEFTHGTDPHRADTDEDGIPDELEINGPLEVVLFDGDADETNDVLLVIEPYLAPPVIEPAPDQLIQTPLAGDDKYEGTIFPGSNGSFETVPAGDDFFDDICFPPPINVCIHFAMNSGPNGLLDSILAGDDDLLAVRIHAGANGIIDSQPVGGDFIRPGHARLFATDPLNRDTDFDGLPDGRELIVGTDPNAPDAGQVLDSDEDGLTDNEEEGGWVLAGTSTRVTSNPLRPDTDLDGLLDVFERAIGSNPRARDTDGDTLSDLQEFDPADLDNYYSNAAMEDAARRCQAADSCVEPTGPSTILRTNINNVDSDADTVNDNIEVTRTWFVSATGPDGTPLGTEEVSSKPYRADDDGDGLNDAEEFTFQTDPSEGDSDQDGTDDGDETVTCFDDDSNASTPSICRDPLVADRMLRFQFTSFVTVDDCDETGFPNAEISKGVLYFVAPNGTETSHKIPGTLDGVCVGEDLNHSGGGDGTIGNNITLDFSRTFLLTVNQTFAARNDANMTECDAGSEDPLQTVSVLFGYTDVAGLTPNVAATPTQDFLINAAAGANPQGGCQFRVNMRITSLVTPN